MLSQPRVGKRAINITHVMQHAPRTKQNKTKTLGIFVMYQNCLMYCAYFKFKLVCSSSAQELVEWKARRFLLAADPRCPCLARHTIYLPNRVSISSCVSCGCELYIRICFPPLTPSLPLASSFPHPLSLFEPERLIRMAFSDTCAWIPSGAQKGLLH